MDQLELQKRKREKLQEIKHRYRRQEGSLYKLFATKYHNTDETPPEQIDFQNLKTHNIRYSAGSSLVNAGFILFIQVVLLINADSATRNFFPFIVFQILATVSLIYFLYRHFTRQVAFRMSHEGIEDAIEEKIYPWDDILATHIYSTYSGKTTRTFLTIDFYDPVNDDFRSNEIDITDFDLSTKRIAGYIEGYKKLYKYSA